METSVLELLCSKPVSKNLRLNNFGHNFNIVFQSFTDQYCGISIAEMTTWKRNALVLRTYGKHKTKVETWLSPDVRKKAFSSTSSSDQSFGELSNIINLRRKMWVKFFLIRPTCFFTFPLSCFIFTVDCAPHLTGRLPFSTNGLHCISLSCLCHLRKFWYGFF